MSMGSNQASTLQCPYCPFATYEFGDGKGEAEMREHMANPHGVKVEATPLQVVDGMTPEGAAFTGQPVLRVTLTCDTCNNWLIMQATVNDALIAYGKHCQEVHPI